MTRTLATILKKVACVGLLAACLSSVPARAQDFGYPPADWLATTTPVYFEGRPAYFWNGHWFYRNGGGWGWYHDEPGYLRDWRGAHREPERRFYEGRGEFHGGGFHRR